MDKNIKKPKISIVMPVYNAEKHLKESMESILNQTFGDFEFIIINDGSTDKSLKIINSFHDSRIKIINNNKNLGLVKSLNKGFLAAQGEYIARMDGDDISLPKRLEEQIKFLNKNKSVDIVGTWTKLIYPFSKFKKNKLPSNSEEIKSNLLFNNPLAHPTIMLRKKILKKYNLYYNEDFPNSEDRYLWARAVEHIKLSNIKKYLFLYRMYKNQDARIKYSNNRKKESNRVKRFFIKKYLKINPTPEEEFLNNTLKIPTNKNPDEFLKKTENWLTKLKLANKQTNFCKDEYFNQTISIHWFEICKENINKKMWAWKKFKTSPLSKNIPIKKYLEILKFFLRNIKKYKQ